MILVLSVETELCEHCKKEVPAENYLMHSAHCKRNIQLCPLCGQAVSRKDAKEHLQEYHEKIDCVQCGQREDKRDREDIPHSPIHTLFHRLNSSRVTSRGAWMFRGGFG